MGSPSLWNAIQSSVSLPQCGTCLARPGIRGTGSQTTRSDPSSPGPGRRTGPEPPPPARPTGPSQTAAWTQSACTAGPHPLLSRTLCVYVCWGEGLVHHFLSTLSFCIIYYHTQRTEWHHRDLIHINKNLHKTLKCCMVIFNRKVAIFLWYFFSTS